jgi:hypothetical protein
MKDNIESGLGMSTGDMYPVQEEQRMLLWDPRCSGIQGNDDANALARKE